MYCGHGTDNNWDESIQLVLQTLHLPWDFDRELWTCRVTEEEKARLVEHIKLRIESRMPLPYITNQAWFCGLPFYVDERVLVPRSPIAELIQQRFSPWWPAETEPSSILDLCTGSGCIGLACAFEFESAQVDLVDISADAIEVAEHNISSLGVDDRVCAITSDLFESLNGVEGGYDIIVSNPPYVDFDDFTSMPEEYQKEPEIGLVAGSDGLDIVRVILNKAGHYLSDNGILVVEVGNSWVALEDAYPDFPFTWVEFEFGGHGVFVVTAEELKSRVW